MYQNYMDDLSQILLVLGQFVTLFFGRFVTSHICHNFILDDLSQVIFVLDDMSKKNSDLG